MLSVKTNIREVLSFADRLSKQYPFAVALALTSTAKAVRLAMPAEVEKDLDNPTPYTKQGFFYTPARKDNLTAVVGVKDRQAEYMRWQVFGGVQQPAKKRLKLPSEVQVDVFGNIPRGLVKQLVRRAEQGKRVTKRLGIKAGISTDAGLFYGKPKGSDLPVGIWKREGKKLTPVIVFPEKAARYEKRFDFEGAAQRVALREFGPALRSAWARAQASAR